MSANNNTNDGEVKNETEVKQEVEGEEEINADPRKRGNYISADAEDKKPKLANHSEVKKEEVGTEPEDNKANIERVYKDSFSEVRTKRRRENDPTFIINEDGEEEELPDDEESSSSSDSSSDDEGRIQLTFIGNNPAWGDNQEQEFSAPAHSALNVCFKRFARNCCTGISHHGIRFIYDGKRLDGKRTPADYGMEDGDQIEAFVHMDGGAFLCNE